MRLPGSGRRELDEARDRVHRLAAAATARAGLAPPAPDDPSLRRLVEATESAFAVLAERADNAGREADQARRRLEVERAEWKRTRAGIAESLAELRERLRRAGGTDESMLWASQHLDDVLRRAGVREFSDEGTVDPARHRIMQRRPADVSHPAGTIASTLRAGLLIDGDVLRPQEVVAYMDMG